jgi:hypothetical protein
VCGKAIVGATDPAGAVLRRIAKRHYKQQVSVLSTLLAIPADEELACALHARATHSDPDAWQQAARGTCADRLLGPTPQGHAPLEMAASA